jgi:hypothetical protein
MSIATILALVLVGAAVLTLLPRTSAKKRCMLGYRALCTFAPVSTVVLAVSAGVVWLMGNLI